MPTFNGETLIVTLDAGEPEVDAKVDLYSDWKEWAKTGANMKYPPAFDTLGGDPTTATGKVAPFYFLRNDLGWRIRPAEEDGNVTITGNLYPRNPSLPLLIPTVGDYTAMVSMERDASSVVELSGSGVTEQDKVDIVDGVYAHADAGRVQSIDVDVIDDVALAPSAGSELADAILDRPNGAEVGMTLRQWLRLGASMWFGTTTGLDTALIKFRQVAGAKDRVTVTMDEGGDRVSVGLDAS